MRAAVLGRAVVVLRDEPGDGRCQLLGEGRAVRGRGEPDLGVERERRDPLAGGRAAGDQGADVTDEPGGQGEQPEGRQAVRRPRRVGLHEGERGRGDHVRRGARLHQPLEHVALAALLDELDQPVLLEGPEVVVHQLPRHPDAGREGGRGGGLGQLGQQAGAHRVQRRLGRGGVLDDGDVEHAAHPVTDSNTCQDRKCYPVEARPSFAVEEDRPRASVVGGGTGRARRSPARRRQVPRSPRGHRPTSLREPPAGWARRWVRPAGRARRSVPAAATSIA